MSQTTRTEPSRRFPALARLALLACTAALVGGAVGWWHGKASAPLISVTAADCPQPELATGLTPPDDAVTALAGELDSALMESLATNVALAARIGSLEEVLEGLEDQDVSPREAVRGVIRGMDERELSTLLDVATGFRSDQLGDMEDVRGFAERLADIAIEGVLEDADEEDSGANAPGLVMFATEREHEYPEEVAQTMFSPDDDEIFAIIPMEGQDDGNILLKWIRVEDRKILYFKRRHIAANTRYDTRGLSMPMGWELGTYRVTVYSGNEALEPIAAGSYLVQ